MKINKLYFLFILFFFLTGCSKNIEQNYVKNIFFNKENDLYSIVVEYYDFSSQEESYIEKSYFAEDVYNLGINMIKDGNYNFRLCENCFINAELFIEDIDKVIYVLNSLKIPPNINLLCYITQETDMAGFKNDKLIYTPLYSLSLTDNTLTGIFQITDNTGKNFGAIFVNSGNPVKALTEKQWQVFNMLNDSARSINYIFRNDQLLATLKNADTFYYLENNVLNIEISVGLKEAKGLRNTEKSKDIFIDFLKKDIENTVYELYNDTVFNSIYNLHWYCRHKGKNCEAINMKINVI